MERTTSHTREKPIVDQRTKFEQQIIDYTKRAVLSSKIILDEDFDVLIDAPLLFPAVVNKNFRLYINTFLSTAGIICVQSFTGFSQHLQCTAVALVPIGYEIFDLFRRCLERKCTHKQIDNFVNLLERHASLNHTVLKHLYNRIKIMGDLEHKVNTTVIKIIEEEDERFANFAAEILATTCRILQQQLIIQSTYSEARYSCIGNWQLESCSKDSSLQEATTYIERTSELYILLASTFMSSTVLGLEVAMWRSHADFEVVFRTIRVIMKTITHSMSCIEAQLQKVFSDFNNSIGPPPKPKPHEQKSMYTDKMNDCKYHLRLCFDLAKIIERQSTRTRYVLLEKMLDNFEHGSALVKNLMKYERNTAKIKHKETISNPVAAEPLRDAHLPQIEENADVGSDDETFVYSPHDSDNENNETSSDRAHGDFDEDTKAAAAVQNLMLLELKNRMRDVRRIKIVKTSCGDLIVQERPLTLQESGGELETETRGDSSIPDLKECMAKPSLTCIQQSHKIISPPSASRFSLTNHGIMEEDEMETTPQAPDKTFLASITAIGKQRNRNEEVFDYVGEEYEGSDAETGEA